MRFRLVLLTIGIASISAIYAQDSRANQSNEKEAPVYSYIYEIKDERDGDARAHTRSPDSTYSPTDTDNRPAVTVPEYSDGDDKLDRSRSNESLSHDESLTIELLNNDETKNKDISQTGGQAQVIQPYIVTPQSQESISTSQESIADSQESTSTSIEQQSYEDASSELQRTARTSYNPDKSSDNYSEDINEPLISPESQYSNFGARVRTGSLRNDHSRNSLRNRTKSNLDLEKKKKVFNGPSKILRENPIYRSPLRKTVESQTPRNDEQPQTNSQTSIENIINEKTPKRDSLDEDDTLKKSESEASIELSTPGTFSRFSKPIVVQEFPRQNRYTYTSVPDVPDVTENTVSSTLRPQIPSKPRVEFNYLQLSPLQAGLALLNSGQVNNTSDSTETPVNDEEKPEETNPVVQEALLDEKDVQVDQEVQAQQEVSDLVTQKVQPVEIQKSVEIYHTSPVQEIHYPVEFVPNVPKVPRERRPSQSTFSIYKSNEILDDKLIAGGVRPNQESYRYEYTEGEFKKALNKPNLKTEDQLNQAAASSVQQDVFKGQDQYPDVYETKPVREYSLDFQRLISQANQEQVQKLIPIAETVDNDQIRKLPQFLVGQFPLEKVVEKTVHIPHPIAIEKLVEKKVPYPIEKVIEKQVMIPHPIHIQIPVDRIVEKQIRIPHIFPIHIEKVVEKKIPYGVPRLVVQPYSVHGPQGPVEKYFLPRPYLMDMEKSGDRLRPYQEGPKFVKVLQGHFPSHQYEKNHQVLVRSQDKTHYQPTVQIYRTPDDNQSNSTQYSDQVYNNGYNVHQILLTRQPIAQVPRKFAYGAYYYPHSSQNGPQSYRRRGVYGGEKEKDYGNQGVYAQPKNSQYSSIEVQNSLVSAGPSRRARQESSQNTGSFRQSKMEYGFKPPMVPSVQYDEKTASKVE